MEQFEHSKKSIHEVQVGDTVYHAGAWRTVCAKDIVRGGMLGTTLFGDSYRSGRVPVIVANLRK